MRGGRASLAELWIRQSALVGALSSSISHDLNNHLASIETNAFLLRGQRSPAGAGVVAGIESAVHGAAMASSRLTVLGTRPLRESSTVRVDDAIGMLRPLLDRLGRDDLTLSAKLAPGAEDALVSSSLFEHGFLTLAALAAELAPARGGLDIVAQRGAQRARVEISLTLAAVQVPDFLVRDGAGLATGLGIGQLVRWFARYNGGDLVVETPTESSVRFNLFLPETQANTASQLDAGGT